MNRDRFVQFACIGIAGICLATASYIGPIISDQRHELQLFEVGEELSPWQAIATTALGSFRGLVVDIASFRASQLQEQDKLYEANTLVQWITTLQPHFPQVWIFHAWNMSYNISHKASTKEERWDWVKKGLNLLKDKGIVYNPHSVGIYRWLSYTYFHKIGGWADDMHWYYKRMVAEEWQDLLGAPIEGATTKQVLERFRPIAEAGDRYFLIDSPTRRARELIEELADSQDNKLIDKQLQRLFTMTPAKAMESLPKHRDQWLKKYPQLEEPLNSLQQVLNDQIDRLNQDPLTMLYQDSPDVKTVVEHLQILRLDLDGQTLKRIGRMYTLLNYMTQERLFKLPDDQLDNTNKKVLAVLIDPKNQDGLKMLLPYLRAKVLIREQHMDPGTMFEIMNKYGPLDWRHPVSHSIYWAFMGVRHILEVPDERTRIDLLNLERGGIVHGLQYMMLRGRISFDPFVKVVEQSINLSPDPRFIPSYEKAMYTTEERIGQYDPNGESRGVEQSFDAGHENFLLGAIEYSYLYGDLEQAEHYYNKVRQLYGNKPHNLRDNTYLQPLDDLVLGMVKADMGQMPTAVAYIESFIFRAIDEGLGESRPTVFQRYMVIAQKAHQNYQKMRSYTKPNAPRERLVLPSFNEMAVNTYAQFMRMSSIDIWRRGRVYKNTPLQLSVQAYPRFYNVVMIQAQQAGYNGQAMFPPPEGFNEMDLIMPQEQEESPETIERK